MAAPLHNNLPPQSQQWVRDIERRMKALEQQNQLLQVTANRNATQIGSVQKSLRYIPLSSHNSDIRAGNGLLSVTAELNVPTTISTVSCVVVASIHPGREGVSGSPITGLGSFYVADDDMLYIDNVIIPEVTSIPGPNDGDVSSMLYTFDANTEEIEGALRATVSANFFGATTAASNSASIMIIALPTSAGIN